MSRHLPRLHDTSLGEINLQASKKRNKKKVKKNKKTRKVLFSHQLLELLKALPSRGNSHFFLQSKAEKIATQQF